MTVPTREQILTAAARLYGEHGFRGTTTRAVAEAAGVNEVTLFRIFGSKESLIVEAMRTHGVALNVGSLPDQPVDPERELTAWATQSRRVLLSIRAMIIQALSDAEQHPEMPKCVARGGEGAYAAIRAYFGRLQDAGFVAADADIASAGALLIGALFNDVMSRGVMPHAFPPASEAPAIYARLCLRALGCDAPARKPRVRPS